MQGSSAKTPVVRRCTVSSNSFPAVQQYGLKGRTAQAGRRYRPVLASCACTTLLQPVSMRQSLLLLQQEQRRRCCAALGQRGERGEAPAPAGCSGIRGRRSPAPSVSRIPTSVPQQGPVQAAGSCHSSHTVDAGVRAMPDLPAGNCRDDASRLRGKHICRTCGGGLLGSRYLSWVHGELMIIVYVGLIPFSILTAYTRRTTSSRLWFQIHRAVNVSSPAKRMCLSLSSAKSGT